MFWPINMPCLKDVHSTMSKIYVYFVSHSKNLLYMITTLCYSSLLRLTLMAVRQCTSKYFCVLGLFGPYVGKCTDMLTWLNTHVSYIAYSLVTTVVIIILFAFHQKIIKVEPMVSQMTILIVINHPVLNLPQFARQISLNVSFMHVETLYLFITFTCNVSWFPWDCQMTSHLVKSVC